LEITYRLMPHKFVESLIHISVFYRAV